MLLCRGPLVRRHACGRASVEKKAAPSRAQVSRERVLEALPSDSKEPRVRAGGGA